MNKKYLAIAPMIIIAMLSIFNLGRISAIHPRGDWRIFAAFFGCFLIVAASILLLNGFIKKHNN